jgi:putative component of membrane protein insertase Oxa1/YidC/SpoIIIJ protein YidD
MGLWTDEQESGQRSAAAVSFVAYAALRFLMWVAPHPTAGAALVSLRPHRTSAAVMRWFNSAYQASSLRGRLKRQGKTCVYLPSCTDYAQRAVSKYGLLRGLMLTGDRFRRCAEGGSGSYVDFP